MKPENSKTHLDLWILAKASPINVPRGGVGSPWSIMYDNDVYMTLEAAQQQQTFEILKNNMKFEIFHLEFPL